MGESFPSIEPGTAREMTFTAVSQTVTDADFALFQRLIEKYAGIYLSPAKKPLLVGRLSRRLRELGISSLHKYYKRVLADPDEHVRMMDCISTNETQFFREPLHFEFLEKRILPRWISEADAGRRTRKVRVWSAGCSSGEEPYSIAMTLLSHLPTPSGWQIDITATDISTRVLTRARAGVWPMEKSRHIPEARLRNFMLRGTGSQEGKMKAGPALQSVIRFERFNLMDDPASLMTSGLDIIFCRNVLIYFQPETKERVVRRLLRHLAADGYLFVGHSESLNHLADCVRSVVPTVYVRSNLMTEC
ncbi:MAG TPA: protein-glutamate O-methyltransferase CheR [Terriglobia bacterium]|nr:protein-glutamate O-methyltransferase CheR [Terriglobia bacterium]